MTPEDAFLAAIIKAPDDDFPRLVFADWLEEHGEDARAEFIRVQCELARMGRAPYGMGPGIDAFKEKRDKLRQRERELLPPIVLATAQALLPGASPGWGYTPDGIVYDGYTLAFRHGFVESIALPCAAWLEYGPQLVKAAPLRKVRLSDKRPWQWLQGHDEAAWRSGERTPAADGWLPEPIFALLTGFLVGTPQLTALAALLPNYQIRVFQGQDWPDAERVAQAALSSACLLWAKGLQAAPWPTPNASAASGRGHGAGNEVTP